MDTHFFSWFPQLIMLKISKNQAAEQVENFIAQRSFEAFIDLINRENSRVFLSAAKRTHL